MHTIAERIFISEIDQVCRQVIDTVENGFIVDASSKYYGRVNQRFLDGIERMLKYTPQYYDVVGDHTIENACEHSDLCTIERVVYDTMYPVSMNCLSSVKAFDSGYDVSVVKLLCEAESLRLHARWCRQNILACKRINDVQGICGILLGFKEYIKLKPQFRNADLYTVASLIMIAKH